MVYNMIKKFALFIFLFSLPSSLFCLTLENVNKWEAPLQRYFSQNKDHLIYTQLYTYLYAAQRDAFMRNPDIKSLDPLCAKLIKFFLPHFTNFPSMETDADSEALAELVFCIYKSRAEKERTNHAAFQSSRPLPPEIQKIAELIPWEGELPCTPPPSFDLKKQMALLAKERQALGEKEFSLIEAWSGRQEPRLEWRIIANQYMAEKSVPLCTVLNVRGLLMMALYDALLASFKGKVTYWIPRPFQLDPSILLLAYPPHSPSYPSTHATLAGAAEVILSSYFPCADWMEIALDSAYTRIWAGVHTPQDVQVGFELGQIVGKKILYTE